MEEQRIGGCLARPTAGTIAGAAAGGPGAWTSAQEFDAVAAV
jgi:hypothetical protein